MESVLMKALWELYQRMSRHGPPPSSPGSAGKMEGGMLERYNWFIANSEHGENCAYAKKCLDLFEKVDYEDIMNLFLNALKAYRDVEGKGFGNGS